MENIPDVAHFRLAVSEFFGAGTGLRKEIFSELEAESEVSILFCTESVPVPELEKENFRNRSWISEAKKSPPLGPTAVLPNPRSDWFGSRWRSNDVCAFS